MSGVYSKGREAILRGDVPWLTADIKAVFVTSAYTPNFTTDQYLSDVPVPARVGVSESLSDKTVTNGWASAEAITWDALSGAACAAFVIVKDTGDLASSLLLAYINSGFTNLPLDPTGTKVTLIPDPATGLFRI